MKRWRVFLKRQAEEDANDIWRLIATDNPPAAEAFLNAIEEASHLLSATPELGSPRYFSHPELHGLRFLPLRRFERYLLFYRTLHDEEEIEIVRIVHGARDLPRLFGGKEKANFDFGELIFERGTSPRWRHFLPSSGSQSRNQDRTPQYRAQRTHRRS